MTAATMARAAVAQTAVLAGLDRMWRGVERERLRLYRIELQANVTSVPLLLEEILADAGFDLHGIVHGLPVPRTWEGLPRSTSFDAADSGRVFLAFAARGKAIASFKGRSVIDRRIARQGALLRPFTDAGGGLGIRVLHGRLELLAELDGALLHVSDAVAVLYLRRRLPEVVASAFVGRPLSKLVSHPVLDRSHYRIASMRDGPQGIGTAIRFGVDTEPFELPWGAELAEITGTIA